ncbi:ABC transporter permease [Fulvivirgaceae bacterium LMO-SS25]
MNLAFFIAQKISIKSSGKFSALVYRIAVAGIAMGVAIMLVSFLILDGFRNEIKQKVFDFSGHVHVSKFTLSGSFEENPINQLARWQELEDLPAVNQVIEVASKPALLRVDDEVEGIVIKGVPAHYKVENFQKYIKEGSFIQFDSTGYTTQVLISETLATRMRLELGMNVNAFFFQDPPRARRLEIVGIYSTGFEDFDKQIIIGDIGMIRRLNDWSDDEAGGMEIYLNSEDDIPSVIAHLEEWAGYEYYFESIKRKYLETFDWLQIITNNVNIFLCLILFVACFNMVSVLFIMIMERTNMIGILKAMGGEDQLIRRIFWVLGSRILFKGILIGNLIGCGLAFVQYRWKVIKLDPENYFMEFVPIQWSLLPIILINVVTILLVLLSLFLPLRRVTQVQPVQSIRFD